MTDSVHPVVTLPSRFWFGLLKPILWFAGFYAFRVLVHIVKISAIVVCVYSMGALMTVFSDMDFAIAGLIELQAMGHHEVFYGIMGQGVVLLSVLLGSYDAIGYAMGRHERRKRLL